MSPSGLDVIDRVQQDAALSGPFTRSHKQAVAGAAEKILSEERFENHHAGDWLQPEEPLRSRRRQPEIWSVHVFLADPEQLFFELGRASRRDHRCTS